MRKGTEADTRRAIAKAESLKKEPQKESLASKWRKRSLKNLIDKKYGLKNKWNIGSFKPSMIDESYFTDDEDNYFEGTEFGIPGTDLTDIDRLKKALTENENLTQEQWSDAFYGPKGPPVLGGGSGDAGYMGYPNYAAWLAAQNRGTGVTEVAEVVEEEVPSNFQGVTMAELPYPKYHEIRIPAAYGGIMDTATGRRGYFLGSIGDALGSVAKAAKKVFKSPVGKAAVMYGLGTYLGGMGAFGGATGKASIPWYSRWKNPALLKNLFKPSGWSEDNLLNPLLRRWDKGSEEYGKFNPWKVGITAASALPFFMPGPEEDDEGDKGSNYDLLRDKYASELMRIKAGVSAGSLNPNQWSYLPSDYTYTGAEGGRAGFYAGGQSIPSEYTMEDAMMTTTQDKLGGITDVMKQADLYRQGSVGQFYAAQGGRIGYDAGGNYEAKIKELIDKGLSRELAEALVLSGISEENYEVMDKAQGGRIGAQEGGLMDLGGMEKDYRQEGGFVPIGGKEKADDVPARLSRNEFVFTADAVRAAGGGDIDKGAEIMENVMKNLEEGGQVSDETQGLAGAQEMFGVSERLSEVV